MENLKTSMNINSDEVNNETLDFQNDRTVIIDGTQRIDRFSIVELRPSYTEQIITEKFDPLQPPLLIERTIKNSYVGGSTQKIFSRN